MKTNPRVFALEFVHALGGDAVREWAGEYYLAEYDAESEVAVPFVDEDGDYIPLTNSIRQAVYLENEAADEPHDEEYAEAVVAALATL